MEIIIPVIIVAVIGLVLGLGLSLAGKYLSDPPDEKLEAIREALPGANCGACGYTGCDDYAAAVKDGIAKPNLCLPGGKDTAAALSEVLGVEISATEKVAFVTCGGDCYKASTKYAYNGIMSCSAAVSLYGGPMDCSFGCIGFGDCVKACEYGGIEIVDGVARVDARICKACGKCVTVCPKNIITLLPKGNNLKVKCVNTDKGAKTMKVCQVGCIGCTKCVKECKHDAIKVENFVAKIDPEKCTGCGDCQLICPRGCITK
ncbi:MAG: RnfABCDGE type electron transport complex subunit B [Acutalibacteraceae bacterium]|nr:RnfABCDGE type electron transport complex subunit B [Acutalibacteraceae bacterium]